LSLGKGHLSPDVRRARNFLGGGLSSAFAGTRWGQISLSGRARAARFQDVAAKLGFAWQGVSISDQSSDCDLSANYHPVMFERPASLRRRFSGGLNLRQRFDVLRAAAMSYRFSETMTK